MQIQKVIEKIGFSTKEAKVYLAALHLGEAHISDIAEEAKLPRSTTQAIADKLHKEGLINFYVRRRYKYWVAEHPDRLVAILQEREQDLKSVLPDLNSALRSDAHAKPTVGVFKGVEEIKLIHDDIIATKHSAQAIISWDEWLALLGESYVKNFIERRARHFLRIDLLVPRTDHSVALRKADIEALRHTRFLPSRIQINTSTFIYGNNVAIISLNKKEPTGVIIEDQDVAHTMTVFFRELWEISGQ